jgi:aspartate carbamoyltransferase catalytic subunit
MFFNKSSKKSYEDKMHEVRESTLKIGSQTKEMLESQKKHLAIKDKRYLEYFWNNKRKVIRKSLPEYIIAFWENESYTESSYEVIAAQVSVDLLKLQNKGFITEKKQAVYKNTKVYELANNGYEYLLNKHPKWIVIFDRMIERTPIFIKIIITLISLIASLIAIIQLF